MLTLEQCQKILNADNKTYTPDQVKEIGSLLYRLAEIEFDHFKKQKDGKDGCHLHTRLDGRAA